LAAPADHPARRSYAGRPLIEAIEDLRTQGLELIYSSDLVRREMRVLAEPVASTPRGILDDLIAPHGLETRDGPGGTILIVARDPDAGPTGGITGRVTGGGDRTPAPGALVSVPGTSLIVLTASDGRFLIPRLPPGSWPLDVQSADGRTQQTVEVPVRAGEMTRVAIELSPAPNVIEEIVVTPTRYRITGDMPETRSSVQGEELARLAHLGDDALRAAARLPGAASGDKSAKFSLRGGEWNEVLVVLDGLEIDQPFHLKEFLAFSGIVDSQAIERVDLLTGGFPVEYGGRMSGVMELSSSTPSERASTSVGTGLPNSRVLMEGKTRGDAVGWLFAARAWYPDAVLDLVDPGGEDINPYYYDLLGKVEFHLDGGTSISGHILAARDQVDFSGDEAEEAARARYDTSYAWLNLGTPWTPRLFSMTQVSVGRVDSSRHGMTDDPKEGSTHIDDQRVSSFVGAKQDWSFRGSERYLFKWGFDARILDAEYDYTSHTEIADPIFTPPGSPSIVDRRISTQPSGNRLGAYAAARAKLLPSVTAEVGIRWDRQSYSGETQADPRVNLVWATGERSTIRAAWGLFHQSQRIDELQVEDGVQDFFPAQRSEHRLISFEHDTDAGFRFRADAYWKVMDRPRPRFENLFNPLALLPEGESDRIRVAPRRATTKGAEVFLKGEPSKAISWWAGYAFATAEDDIDDRTEPRSWDQRHAVNLGMGYRFKPGWEIDLAGVWHSGWPTTRVAARAVTDPNGAVTILPTLGPRNAESFPPSPRLDVKLTRRIQLPESTLTLFLEVLNLYDRRNVCCVDDFGYHPEPGGSVRVTRREDFWLERLPSFGINWKF
jgi:outer membrane receptor protein involved in Fe transport